MMSNPQYEAESPAAQTPEEINQEMFENLQEIEKNSNLLGVYTAVQARIALAQLIYVKSVETIGYNESRWRGILSVGAEASQRALAQDPPSPEILFTELDLYLNAHPEHQHDEVIG